MYEAIKGMVEKLGKSYRYQDTVNNRAILQEIKVEAQNLRKKLSSMAKAKTFDAKEVVEKTEA